MPKVSREGLKPCNHILTYTWSTTQRENEELLGKMSMTLYRVRVREGLLSTIKDCAKSWASNCPADQEFGAKPKYPTVQSLQHPFPSSTLLKSNTSPSPSCLFFFLKGEVVRREELKGKGMLQSWNLTTDMLTVKLDFDFFTLWVSILDWSWVTDVLIF